MRVVRADEHDRVAVAGGELGVVRERPDPLVAEAPGQGGGRLAHAGVGVDDGDDARVHVTDVPEQREVADVLVAHHAGADDRVAERGADGSGHGCGV